MAQYSRHPRIRIISDGVNSLQIIETATGEEILKGCVRSVTWKMEPPDFRPVASIELVSAALDGVGDLPELTVEREHVME